MGASPGVWRKPWSDALQAKWLEAVTDIALSKPFVEAICWQDFVDLPVKMLSAGQSMPFGGLTTVDLAPKPALRTWVSLRKALMNFRQQSNAAAHAAPPAEAAEPKPVPPVTPGPSASA
jgi:hypothetical protein